MVHNARSFVPDKSCAATRILLCGPPLPPKPSVLRRRDACWQSPYHISRWPAATPWAFSAFVLRSDLDLAIVIDLCASRAWWSHYSSKWVNVMPKVGHQYRCCLWWGLGVSGGGGWVMLGVLAGGVGGASFSILQFPEMKSY